MKVLVAWTLVDCEASACQTKSQNVKNRVELIEIDRQNNDGMDRYFLMFPAEEDHGFSHKPWHPWILSTASSEIVAHPNGR